MRADPSEPEEPGPNTPARSPRGPLSDEWPAFLDFLASDPGSVFRPLHDFVHRLLEAFPPHVFGALRPSDREEMPGRILLRLCENDFRRLRTFRPRGVPFAQWVLCIARNMARDMIEHQKLEGTHIAYPEGATREGPPPPGADTPSPRPWPDMEAFLRRNLEQVVEIISAMDRKCRLLLVGSAGGLTPKQLTHLLGWPATWNKKAADDRRHCRHKLRELIRERGLESGGLF